MVLIISNHIPQGRHFSSKLNNNNKNISAKKKKILMKQFRTEENYIIILKLESNILKQAHALIERKWKHKNSPENWIKVQNELTEINWK